MMASSRNNGSLLNPENLLMSQSTVQVSARAHQMAHQQQQHNKQSIRVAANQPGGRSGNQAVVSPRPKTTTFQNMTNPTVHDEDNSPSQKRYTLFQDFLTSPYNHTYIQYSNNVIIQKCSRRMKLLQKLDGRIDGATRLRNDIKRGRFEEPIDEEQIKRMKQEKEAARIAEARRKSRVTSEATRAKDGFLSVGNTIDTNNDDAQFVRQVITQLRIERDILDSN